MYGPVHRGKKFVPGRCRERTDGRVGHHLPVLPDQVEWNVVDHVALAVCQGMSFDKTLQVGFLGRSRELRQPEKLLHDAVSRTAVAGPGAGHFAAAHHVHEGPPVEERLIGIAYPAIEHLHLCLGDLPLRTVHDFDHVDQVFEQRAPVASGIRMPLVLYERTVFVKAIARSDCFEFGFQPFDGHIQFRRVLREESAGGHRGALPYFVGPGGRAFVGYVGSVMVHRRFVAGPLFGRQVVIQQRHDSRDVERRADDEHPPVVVERDRRIVAVGLHPVHAVDDVPFERIVAVKFRSGRRYGQGHVIKAAVRDQGDGRYAFHVAIFPEPCTVRGFVHRCPVLLRESVHAVDAVDHRAVVQVESGRTDQRFTECQAHLVERAGLG